MSIIYLLYHDHIFISINLFVRECCDKGREYPFFMEIMNWLNYYYGIYGMDWRVRVIIYMYICYGGNSKYC